MSDIVERLRTAFTADQMRAYAAACVAAEREQWRENSSLEKWFPLTAEQLAAKERENLHLAREARTWWEAAQTYATELERHKPLLQAVEWLLDEGHMNTEHLARLRAAWEDALGPNARANREPT